VQRALWSLFLAYCVLLVGPASQLYARVDAWQDLGSIARAIEHDAMGRPLILFAPDETTRAIIDMYARTEVDLIPGPVDAAAADRLNTLLQAAPQSLIVAQLPRIGDGAQRALRNLGLSRGGPVLRPAGEPQSPAAESRAAEDASLPPWVATARLRLMKRYSLPHGRRYALFELQP
jgi:hypothetical protein